MPPKATPCSSTINLLMFRLTAAAKNKLAKRTAALFIAVAVLVFTEAARAQTTLFWDANGATTGTGGTGNWLTTNTWRSDTSTGTLGNWSDGNRANFGGTAGTVTLNGAVSATGLTFSIGGYTISGANSLTLTSTSTGSGAQAMETTNSSGTNTIDVNIVLGAAAGLNQRFSIASGGTLIVNGDISETNAGIILSKSGAGTLTLFGNNSYSGGTLLTLGTIAVGSDTALGSGPLTFTDGTTLRSADANTRTLANVWTPGSGSSNTIFGSATTGDLILTDATSFGLGVTVKTFTVNNNTTTLSKIFTSTSAGNGLTKAGTGTLVLKGASTYNGATLVNVGTLLANNTTGSATGTGPVSVNNSGTTLGGTGTISGTVTLGNTTPGAILNPGPKGTAGTAASVGTLTTGALTLTGANTFHVDAFGTATTEWDKLVSTGAIALGSTSTLGVTIASGLNFTAGMTYVLLNGTSLTGTFSGITDGQTVTFSGYQFIADYTTTGFDLVAVPEPSTWIGGALALGLIGWTQRTGFARRLTI